MSQVVPRILALTLAWLALLATPALAEGLEITGEIAGQDITQSDSLDPIELEPKDEIPLAITIRNTTDRTEAIRYVRLEGEALGLTFLSYDLGVRTTLGPGEQTTVTTPLDFFDLDEQATGYLGAGMKVYDTERREIGSTSFVVDVRGKATSTLGLFAFLVLAIAVFSVTVLVINTVRRRLPANRFVRAIQFAIAGTAIGLTLALGVSILRIAFADVEAWVPLVVIPTVIGFLFGYIAPGPLSQSIEDVKQQEELDAAAEDAVVRASGSHAAATSGRFDQPDADG